MSIENIAAFILATFIFGFVPGPGVIAVSAKCMKSGKRSAIILSMGILTGDLIYLLFALLGLSSIAQPMGELFIVIRYLGAAYLIFLGYRLWITPSEAEQEVWAKKRSSEFLNGLFISLGNPKVIVFYLGFLPVFWDLSKIGVTEGVVIVSIIIATLSIVFAFYTLVADKGRRFMNTNFRKHFNRLSGSFLIFMGLRIARD